MSTFIKRVLKSIALLSIVLPPTLAHAASAPALKDDWTGVWKRVGTFSYDPTIPAEQREFPPYKADWQARYEVTIAKAAKGDVVLDASAACLPPGMPRVMNMVYPMEIIQKPDQMTIIAEWDSQVRRIFLDGRPHPSDPDPTFNGHSIGHWENNVLVVDTIGVRDDTVFDATGIVHSAQMHLIERFWLADPNTLKDEITAEDPVAFYKPWVVTKTYKRAPGINIMEYVCEENNRNPVDASGRVGVVLKNSGK